jgi:hypothetical protein
MLLWFQESTEPQELQVHLAIKAQLETRVPRELRVPLEPTV